MIVHTELVVLDMYYYGIAAPALYPDVWDDDYLSIIYCAFKPKCLKNLFSWQMNPIHELFTFVTFFIINE